MSNLVAAVAAGGTFVLAAEEVLPSWAQAGILGLVILGFVTKQLVPGYLYQDARAELKEVRAEHARLVQALLDTQSTVIPALDASTNAVSEALVVMRRGSSP